MLIFDTTRPHSMWDCSDTRMRDGAPEPQVRHVPDDIHYSFYIHGQAEEDVGFDVPVLPANPVCTIVKSMSVRPNCSCGYLRDKSR
jgi:hypothetical protein